MQISLALTLVLAFLTLSVWHVYWAAGGRIGKPAAIGDGKTVFVPGAFATLFVAVGLGACAALVAATAGLIPSPLSTHALGSLSFALASALLLRAIGDFRFVGFFKRAGDGAFARRDTVLYSPICLVLALAVGMLAVLSRP
jgi:hypothetical protein